MGSLKDISFNLVANVAGFKKSINAAATTTAKGTRKITKNLQTVDGSLHQVTSTYVSNGKKWEHAGSQMASATDQTFTGMMKTMISFKTFMAKIMHYITFSIGVQLVMRLKQAFSDMITTFSDFQHSATMAASVSGRLGAGLDDMTTSIMNVGVELGKTTIFMATEATDAFYSLASAGFDVASAIEDAGDNAKDILKPFTDLAAAVGADLPEATELVSKTIKMFGYELEDARDIVDMFTGAITNSFLTFKRLADGMQYVGAIAGSLGVTLQDTTASLATLVDKGMTGSQAGRRLRMILTKLIDPTVKGEKALNELGVTMDMLNPELHTMSEIFLTLQSAGYKAVHAAKMFRGATAGAAAAIVDSADSIDMYIHKFHMATGVTEKLAEVQEKSFWGQLRLLKAAFEALSIEIGSVLLPVMKGFATFIKKDLLIGIRKFGAMIAGIAPNLEVTASGIRSLLISLSKLVGIAAGAAFIVSTLTHGVIRLKYAFLGLLAPVALLGLSFGEFSNSGEDGVNISKLWLPILISLSGVMVTLIRLYNMGTLAKVKDVAATFMSATASQKLAKVISYLTGIKLKEISVSKLLSKTIDILTLKKIKEAVANRVAAGGICRLGRARVLETKGLLSQISLYGTITATRLKEAMVTRIQNIQILGHIRNLYAENSSLTGLISAYASVIVLKWKEIAASKIANITGSRGLTLNRLRKVSLTSLIGTYVKVTALKYKDILAEKLSYISKLKNISITNLASAATTKLAAIKGILTLTTIKETAASVASTISHGIQAVAMFVLGGAALTTAGTMTILSAAMLPITLIALGIVAAIGAVIYIWKNWGKISKKLGSKIKPVVSALETIGKVVATVIVVYFRILYRIISWVWEKFIGFAQFIYDTLKPAFDALGKVIKTICDGLGMIWGALKVLIPGFQDLEDIVIDTAKAIFEGGSQLDKFNDALDNTKEYLDNFNYAAERVTGILDIQSRIFKEAKKSGKSYTDVLINVTKAEAELLDLDEQYMNQTVDYNTVFDSLVDAKENLSKKFGEFTGEIRNQSKALSIAISEYNKYGEINDEVMKKVKLMTHWEFAMFQEYMNTSSALNEYNKELTKYNMLNSKRNLLQMNYNEYQKRFDERLKSIHDKQQKLYNIRLKMYKLQHDEIGSYEDLFNSLASSGQMTAEVKKEYQDMMKAQISMKRERADYTDVLGDMNTENRETMTKWVENYISALDSGVSKEEAMAQANQQTGITFSKFAGLSKEAQQEILEYGNAASYSNQQASEFREVAMGLAGDLVDSGQATSDIANQYFSILKNVTELQKQQQEYNDTVVDENESLEETKNLIKTVGRLWQYYQEIQGLDKDGPQILEEMAKTQGTYDEIIAKYGSMEDALNEFYNTSGKNVEDFSDTQKMTFMTAIDMLDEQGQSLSDLDYTTLADSIPIRKFELFQQSVYDMVDAYESSATSGEEAFNGLAETIEETFEDLKEHLNYLNQWDPDMDIEMFDINVNDWLKTAEPVDINKIINWDETIKQLEGQEDLAKLIMGMADSGKFDGIAIAMVMEGMSRESPEEYFNSLPDKYQRDVISVINNSSLDIKVNEDEWDEIKEEFRTYEYPSAKFGLDISGAETSIDQLAEYIKNNLAKEYTITIDVNNKGNGDGDDEFVGPPAPPGFARGLIAKAPTLGIFGEAGAEAIVPLEGSNKKYGFDILKSIIPKYFPSLMMANGGVTSPSSSPGRLSTSNIEEYNFYGDFNITGVDDAEELYDEFMEKLRERSRMR